MIRRFMIPGLLACVLLPVMPARAGTYSVSICGSLANPSTGTAGWNEFRVRPGFHYAAVSCAGDGFGVGVEQAPTATTRGVRTGWTLTLPAPLTVSSMDVHFLGSVTLWSGWSTEIWGLRRGTSQWLTVIHCAGDHCDSVLHRLPMYDVGAVGFGVSCGDEDHDCAAGTHASIYVSDMRLNLTDPSVPRAALVGGALSTNRPVAGVASVSFRATDAESGVRSAALLVDGRVLGTRQFDTASHSCVEPYTSPKPCPQSVTGSFTVDTRQLLDGYHQVQLAVHDATQQNTAVVGPWTVDTRNATVSNLCPSSIGPSARIRLRPNPVRFGHGAALSVLWPAVPWPSVEAVIFRGTDRLVGVGRAVGTARRPLVLDVPPGKNRTLRVGLRPVGSHGPFACSGPVVMRVRAGVRLKKVTPHMVRNGHRVRICGKLAGGRSAAHRALILEARAKGGRKRWVPVHVMRTDRHGKFHFAYRFRRTFQRTTFMFRVRCPSLRGFPYAPGRSRVRRVVVRPLRY